MTQDKLNQAAPASRRDFLKTSTLAVAGAATAGRLLDAPPVHAAGSDLLRVGLIGCGGRGTGAAENCVRGGENVKLVALADMFKDRIEEKSRILKEELGDKYAVKNEHCFVGFNAYKDLLACGVDVVVLGTPPHFRPAHLKAAVEAGKHIFAEKPVAVDAPGVRSVLESCKEAQRKGLSVVSGLCWRYHHGMRDAIGRVHGGAIGDIVAMQCTFNTGTLWHKSLEEKAKHGWSDMEWQLRNWLYFTWLSGDHNVEQHVHSLDKMAWAMKNEYPKKAVGLGGRQVRTAPDFGHIYDHHAVIYEFENGVRCYSFCRQQARVQNEVGDQLVGTKGVCDILASRGEAIIKSRDANAKPWSSRQGRQGKDNMYQNEHDELIASIRNGKPINDGDWMTKSTLMAIMGRMATYTGQEISWEMALNSKEDLTPAVYKFGPLKMPEVALPGVTKFV